MSPSVVEPKPVARVEQERAPQVTDRPRGLDRLVAPMGGARLVSAAMGGLLATMLWIALFTVGISVPSQPFRDGLLGIGGGQPAQGAYVVAGVLDAVFALGVVAFSYTPTNLAMLCCTASLVGCLAYTATHITGERGQMETLLVTTDAPRTVAGGVARDGEPTIPLRPAISAITWGFFIYLFLISGTLLASQSPFSATTPDQYLRLAGTASLLAFVVGWRPEVIARLVTQIGQSRISAGEGTGPK